MSFRNFLRLIAGMLGLALTATALAQTQISEDFTQTITSVNSSGQGNWLFSGGACLTAGTSPVTNPQSVPACVLDGINDVLDTYYVKQHGIYAGDRYLVGGSDGYLGTGMSTKPTGLQSPDASGNGALRFTNGYDPLYGYATGHGQNGAIVSSGTYSTSQGIQVIFKTVTYHGDSLNGSGADGMSFYLLDGCVPLSLNGTTVPVPSGCTSKPIYGNSTFALNGAWGGSLAYTCSNSNSPYDGLVGGYLGLGIDEYGNFLNQGDNTASGWGYVPSRIGLRGAGNISWQALTNAYGTDPHNSALPYYPASLAQGCSSGTYDSGLGMCESCPTGTYNPGQGTCTISSFLGATTVEAIASAANNASALAAVQQTCANGTLFNYSNPGSPTSAGTTTLATAPGGNANNTAGIMDYPALAYQTLSGTSSTGTPIQIANESAMTRTITGSNPAAILLYNLQITSAGLLSLSYSYNGAAYQSVLKNQSITNSNGPLPALVRYGFAGSTGGGSNVHEILCFQSQPVNVSQSSTGVNQKQSAEIQPNGASFAYFSFYDTLDWAGRLTANALTNDGNTLVVSQTPTWDASCVLTGSTAPSCSGYAGSAEVPASRVILTYGTSGTGKPFEASGIAASQLSTLNFGDPSSDSNRLNYLRGDRSEEVANASPPCPQYIAPTTGSPSSPGRPCFRARDSVLGDIVDSSPVWVGPPQSPYTATWSDRLNATATPPENTGSQNYLQFIAQMQTRTNMVYVGANDGMLHGFRSGAYNSSGTFNTSAPNDGEELLAYVPGSVLQDNTPSNGSTGCTSPVPSPMTATLSTVQNIHGVSPAAGTEGECTAPSLDYSDAYYGHDFYVDATPGTGDLFYDGVWHTWLVGGMGPGGAAIYALDITNPSTGNTSDPTYPGFTEANASSLVIGEWTSANLTCANDSACGTHLGNTYGTPIIRRLHDGEWAVIFGNGYGSAAGDAGIFVMTVDKTGTPTFWYFSTGTGSSGSPDGIGYVTSADLDGDHITDYVYAGDLQGYVWRFDLTDTVETNWGVTQGALFKTPTGQPITTAVTVASGQTAAGANTLIIGFGTGEKSQLTNTSAASYIPGQQSIYGVWDWNMGTSNSGWNSKGSVQYASLTPSSPTPVAHPAYTASGAPGTLGQGNLAEQVAKVTTNAYTDSNNNSLGEVSITTNATVCWASSSTTPACSPEQYGWYMNLPSNQEQVVYSPQVLGNAFVVNSTVPASNSPLSCKTLTDTGYTYAVSMLTGGAENSFFTQSSATQYHDAQAIGEQTNATGTSFPITTANGQNWLVYQTVSDTPSTLQVNLGANYVGRRLTWVQLR